MNIQLRRRRNRSLINQPNEPKHEAKSSKFINSPAGPIVFDFILQNESRISSPNAGALSPQQPRKRSSIKLMDSLIKRNETPEVGSRNKTTSVSFIKAGEGQTGVDFYKSQKNQAEKRPTSAMEKSCRVTWMSETLGVEKKLEDDFKQYVSHKIKERERMRRATSKVVKNDEEYRESVRKKIEEDENKRKALLENLVKKNKEKVKTSQKERKEMEEKLAEKKKEYFLSLKEKKKNLQAKLTNSEIKKQEADSLKLQKVSDWNSFISEKQQDMLEKRDQNEDIFLKTLSKIEGKVGRTTDRKRKILEDRMTKSQKHSVEVEERHKKAEDNTTNRQFKFLQKVANKLVKVRSKSAITKKVDGHSDKEWKEKCESANKRKLNEEKQKLTSFLEKEKVIFERMQKRDLELQEYVFDKKDEWIQRLSLVKNNLQSASKANEKKLEFKLFCYKDKVELIKLNKLNKKKELESIDKSFQHEDRFSQSFYI